MTFRTLHDALSRFGAIFTRRRAAKIDASYAVYDDHPLDEADAWGDLASFRPGAAGS